MYLLCSVETSRAAGGSMGAFQEQKDLKAAILCRRKAESGKQAGEPEPRVWSSLAPAVLPSLLSGGTWFSDSKNYSVLQPSGF